MIYLDYAATTPTDPRVLEAMRPYLETEFGNPSSIHGYGQATRKAIDEARTSILSNIGAFSPHELVFTSGGTESCNMAIFGAAFARKDQGKHLIVSGIEHPAVLEPAFHLRDHFGFEVTVVNPDSEGFVHPEAIEAAMRPDTILISVMLANNEIGTIQPIAKIAGLARKKGVLIHTDACQAPGYADINVERLGVDLLTLNGSKLYGPKGAGILYVRQGLKIMPQLFGGGQEFRMRGGTENVAAIVGFAKALDLVLAEKDADRIQKLRDVLLDELLALPGISLNGARNSRLANNINVHVEGKSGESLVMRLDMEGLAASSGSACSSGKTEPSAVLLALGQSKQKALESLRLTLGKFTTEAEVQEALSILKRVLLQSA